MLQLYILYSKGFRSPVLFPFIYLKWMHHILVVEYGYMGVTCAVVALEILLTYLRVHRHIVLPPFGLQVTRIYSYLFIDVWLRGTDSTHTQYP